MTMTNTNVDPNVGTRKWTKFVLVENGKVKRLSDAPLTFKTSTGQRPTDEWLVTDGYCGFIDALPPTYNKYTQKVVKTPIEDLVIDPKTNTVTQTWTVTGLGVDETSIMQDVLRRDINAERDKRIEFGCTVEIKGVAFVVVSGKPTDMINLTNLGQLANVYVASGQETKMVFRDAWNNTYELTPTQMSTLWQKAMAYVTAVYQASWRLKEMNPLPQDFNDNSYWPDPAV